MICFTIVNGARDFHTANRLTADFLSDPQRRIEDHHIFATAYLKKRLGRPAENSILNRCLIDNVTNKVISDKPPSIYLKEIEEHLGAERLEDVLTSHLIPTVAGAPKRDDADAFLKAREQLILKAVASITGAPLPSRNEIRLLPGPGHVTDKLKRAFGSFSIELRNRGSNAEWRVLLDDVAGDLHARALFDDDAAWELPPLNSLYRGTVDSIRLSKIPRQPFEQAWGSAAAMSLAAVDVKPPEPV